MYLFLLVCFVWDNFMQTMSFQFYHRFSSLEKIETVF